MSWIDISISNRQVYLSAHALRNSICNTLCCTSHHNRDALHFQPQHGASHKQYLDCTQPWRRLFAFGQPQPWLPAVWGCITLRVQLLGHRAPSHRNCVLPLLWAGLFFAFDLRSICQKVTQRGIKANKFQGYQEALASSPGFWLLSSFHSSFNTQTLSDFGLSVLICKTRTAWPLALLTAKSGTKKNVFYKIIIPHGEA